MLFFFSPHGVQFQTFNPNKPMTLLPRSNSFNSNPKRPIIRSPSPPMTRINDSPSKKSSLRIAYLIFGFCLGATFYSNFITAQQSAILLGVEPMSEMTDISSPPSLSHLRYRGAVRKLQQTSPSNEDLDDALPSSTTKATAPLREPAKTDLQEQTAATGFEELQSDAEAQMKPSTESTAAEAQISVPVAGSQESSVDNNDAVTNKETQNEETIPTNGSFPALQTQDEEKEHNKNRNAVDNTPTADDEEDEEETNSFEVPLEEVSFVPGSKASRRNQRQNQQRSGKQQQQQQKGEKTTVTATTSPKENQIPMVVLRAIGNPLPPRHDPEQAVTNLKFMLENEPEFPNVSKHWVLNHIVDDQMLKRLTDLLELHNRNYTVIPFSLQTYFDTPYNFDNYKKGFVDPIHSMDYIKGEHRKQREIVESVQADKNLYVTNQNAARNEMIEIGKSQYPDAEWILPLDGNCYFHQNAFGEFASGLEAVQGKYAIIPMARAQSNDELLSPSYRGDTREEPQIAFHRDARARFHPRLRYGRRNKVEMLERLNYRGGEWKRANVFSNWETDNYGPFHEPIPEFGSDEQRAPQVGWVTRLSSGNAHLEEQGKMHDRWNARGDATTLLLKRLDAEAVHKLLNFTSSSMLFYQNLDRDREAYQEGNPEMVSVVNSITGSADRILQDKGRQVGSAIRSGQDSRLMFVHRNVTKLALGYFMTGETKYGDEAARIVKSLYLNPSEKMRPEKCVRVNRSQLKKGSGMELGSLWFFLDGVRILEKANFFTEQEQSELRSWFTACFDWLENSEEGLRIAAARDHMGLYSDIQSVALAAYTNQADKMVWYLDTSIWRMRSRFTPFGEIRHLPTNSGCEIMSFYQIYGWSVLARLGEAFGRDLWKESKDTSGESLLCRATQFVVPLFLGRDQCANDVAPFDSRMWWGLAQKGQQTCGSLSRSKMVIPQWFPEGSQLPPESRFATPNLERLGMAPYDSLGA